VPQQCRGFDKGVSYRRDEVAEELCHAIVAHNAPVVERSSRSVDDACELRHDLMRAIAARVLCACVRVYVTRSLRPYTLNIPIMPSFCEILRGGGPRARKCQMPCPRRRLPVHRLRSHADRDGPSETV
jgi:hypothetical protein